MTRPNALLMIIAAGCCTVGTARLASAQYSGANSRNIYSATRNYLYNRPTVSPYLNLTTRDGYNGLPNYFTLVRPQIEQREANIAQQQQSARMQTQINSVQQQAAQTQSQMSSMMLTGRVGWSSRGYPRFGTYLNFYPGFQQIRRR